jgi:hypothetical protein
VRVSRASACAILDTMSLTPQPRDSHHPEYNMISYHGKLLFKHISLDLKFVVIPEKAGKHRIPVYVCAKGIYDYHTSLFLTVVG